MGIGRRAVEHYLMEVYAELGLADRTDVAGKRVWAMLWHERHRAAESGTPS